MKEIIKNGLILFAITVIAGSLLGLTYEVTKQPIVDAQNEKTSEALEKIFPNHTFGSEMLTVSEDLTDLYPYINGYYDVYDGTALVGYAFKLVTPEGYGGNIELLVGVHMDGYITGIDIIKHSETPGLGAKASEPAFKDQFIDKALSALNVVKSGATEDNDIQAISAATISSRAITVAVNQVIDYYHEVLAGEVE